MKRCAKEDRESRQEQMDLEEDFVLEEVGEGLGGREDKNGQ